MTNKDMVPRHGPGPAPRDRNPPQGPKKDNGRGQQAEMDPPDSPQVKPSLDRK